MSVRKPIILTLAVFLAVSCGIGTGVAEAKVYLDVYGNSFKKVTIAVPPFRSTEKERGEVSDVLGQDLDMSGFFVVAPRSIMDKEFLSEGVEKKDIRFEQWRSLGVEFLCKAVVQEKDNAFSLEAYLYDANDGTLLFGKRYRATSAEWRRIVHRLADDIILSVTGEKGIMSSRVLFVSGSKRHRDVYVSDLDGNGVRKLTQHNQIVVSPSVSPDGRYIAFTSYKEGRPNLYVIDLETNSEVYVAKEDGMKVGATWIDKKTLAYSHTSGAFSTIFSVNVETKEQKVLLKKDGIILSPTFSPDGSKMVFVSDMYGGVNIFVRDIATGDIRRLSHSGSYNTSPAFSPKGDLIAFVSRTGPDDFEICTMRPDGSNAQVLTDGGINDSPHFSPCGRYILYASQKGNRTGLFVMLYNGENRRQLRFTNGEETQPKFMP
jgi:TolB protein